MPRIIAELCQNHMGSRSLLQDMIAAAADAGADVVKMQTIFSEDLTRRDRFEEGETEENGVIKTIKRPYTPELKRLSTLDLTEDDHRFFIEECVKRGVTPMTTVFSRMRVPFVASLPWPERTVKVASYDCASVPLLSELADTFDHLIVSTGATFDDEIARAADIVRGKGKKLTFLHCVTSYPNPLDMCNLARMEWLRTFASEVGWSDHTLVERDGVKAAKVALALGADVIERHFTILEKDQTKDGPVSITPPLLRELAQFAKLPVEERYARMKEEIPEWPSLLGSARREMTHTEALNRDYYRGRFASHIGGTWIHNWDVTPIPSAVPA